MNRIESLFVNFQLLRSVSTMIKLFEQCHERKESSHANAALGIAADFCFPLHLHTFSYVTCA